MTAAFDAWVAKARGVRIEDETMRRAIELKGNGAERVGPCPKCGGGTDRFSINIKKQVWNCRICGVGGDVIDLVKHLDGVDFIAACTTLNNGTPPPKTKGKNHNKATKTVVVKDWTYQTEDGTTAFVVERVQFRNGDGSFVLKDGKPDKKFWQKRPDPKRPGAWLYNVDGAPVIPYRLPELIEAAGQGKTILIVEGEAKVDLLRDWNIPATCNAMGAENWRAELSSCV
jgi:hypothetical protein